MSNAARADRREASARRSGVLASLWPALLVGSVTLAGAFVVGNALRERETRALEAATSNASRVVLSEVERRMQDYVRALERLAANWQRRGGLARPEFEAEAEDLTRDFSNLQAIGWVDPRFRVRWLVPEAGNEAAEGLDLKFEERRRQALERSRDQGVTVLFRPNQLAQGGMGLVAFVPLVVDEHFDGFLSGVWRTGDLFAELLRNVVPGFTFRIFDKEELIYARDDSDALWRQDRIARVRSASREWIIEVAPLPPVVEALQTELPRVVVLAGAAVALALAITAYLATSRRIRNRILAAEMRRRESLEQTLARVMHELPDHVWSGELTAEGFESTYFSPVASSISGYPEGKFEKSPESWYEIILEEDRKKVEQIHADLVSGQRDSIEIEYRIRRLDGTLRWILDRVHTTPTERGMRFDGVASDITEAKRSEAERLQNQQERTLLIERARMTREMHDGLGGHLVSTLAMLERGQASPGDLAESLRRALDDMRIVMDSLDPMTADLSTSLGRLRARLEPLLARNGLALRWRIEELPGLDAFSPEQSLHLLRIIQEAVTNAVVHANATFVSVTVRAGDDQSDGIIVEIRDDGRGFRPEAVSAGRGIRNMKSRTAALGAELRFEDGEPGTRIELRIFHPH